MMVSVSGSVGASVGSAAPVVSSGISADDSVISGSVAAGSVAAGSVTAGSVVAGSVAAGSVIAGSVTAGSCFWLSSAASVFSSAASDIPSSKVATLGTL